MKKLFLFILVLFSNNLYAYNQQQDFINYIRDNFFDFSYGLVQEYENQNFLVLNNVILKNSILESSQIKNLWISYDYQTNQIPTKGRIVIERLWIPDEVLESNFPYTFKQIKSKNLDNSIFNFAFNYELYEDNFNLKSTIDSRDFGASQIDINIFVSNQFKKIFNERISKDNIFNIIANEKFRSIHFRAFDKRLIEVFTEDLLKYSWKEFETEMTQLISEDKKLSIVDKQLLNGFLNSKRNKVDFTIYIPKNMRFDMKIKDFINKLNEYESMNFFGNGLFWAVEK